MRLARSLASLSFLAVAAAISFGASAQTPEKKGFALSNDKPIQIESDNLQLREQEKKALFDGNVKVVQGEMTLTSDHMIVYYKARAIRWRPAAATSIASKSTAMSMSSPARRARAARKAISTCARKC